MLRAITVIAVLNCLLPGAVSAADHRVEPLNAMPPKDAISAEIAVLLAPNGVKIVRGESRTVCEIWLCRQWTVPTDKLADGINYPFQPGQLIGLIRFPRKASDFRNQDVAEGVYTLRYAQQPVDGAHVGTSVTRDFLLLIQADKDKSPAVIEYKPLTKQSAEAAGSNHPALFSLQKAEGDDAVAIRHDEGRDWWIVHLLGKLKKDTAEQSLAMDLLVVGHAEE